MLSEDCKSNEDFIRLLLDGVLTGEYKVAGYTSEWPKRGPANQRKVTVIIEDSHFDKHGKRVKPDVKVSKLYDEYNKLKDIRTSYKAEFYRFLDKMVAAGEAKSIEGPEPPLMPAGVIVTRDKDLMAKIVSWDIDDNEDLVFYFDGDDEPHRCDDVELW